jgi:hypothetical protein
MNRRLSGLTSAGILTGSLLAVAFAGAGAPPGRYTITGGAVIDSKSGLTWQQTVSTSTYTQAQAASYCAALSLNGAGWRLPALRELVTIVDVTVANPSVDSSAFPGTPVGGFWSSTPYVGTAGTAWGVNFAEGFTGREVTSGLLYARCVRSGG